ncbi:MAG: leucine-rich repeat domain-containing protein, partial [Duncaniella sp.]|nr:leucine-rich repeat domain-containing protein [Duncaniella sp.]
MNDKDFDVLRAYLSADGTGKHKRLSLDLSNGEFTTMPKFVFSNGDFYGNDNPNPVIGLKEIDLPEGLTEIPEGAFSDCFNLERVGLSSTVAKMWGIAFYRTALKRLDGQSVTTIYENVFEACHELTCVVVGNLAEIRMAAFRDCIKLETFDMTRCTKVPAASHNIFGNNNTETPQLTIYVGSADILNTLSNDAKWNITNPKWAIGSPGK